MATVNQLQPIESILTPDESNWFRKNAPHFLDALRMQQTVINQLVIRVGGSGSGTTVVNLDDITDAVYQLENQDAEAALSSLAGRVSHLENLVCGLLSEFKTDTRALDLIDDLRRETHVDSYNILISRIEALEAQL